jgi:methyltransferase (TIGR00027 family)
MHNDRPSRTAIRVAMRRAAHQLLDDPLVFRDPLATRILGPARVEAIRANLAEYDRKRGAKGLRALLAARSRVAEDALAVSVVKGVRQYVVLGAGLDTFAYRNPHEADGLRVFEVDHPGMQAWKRGALHKFEIAIPESVTFVPVDFERQVAATELRLAGFDPTKPAFFSWLGVTMYLLPDTVMQTLGWIAEASRGGGGVVFDYSLAASELGLVGRLIYHMVARRVRRAGEPWLSRFVPARLVADMHRLGFTDVEDLAPEVINSRYFAGRSDGLRVHGLAHIMRAGC